MGYRRWNYRLILLGALIVLIILGQFPFFSPVRDFVRRGIGAPARFFDAVTNKLTNTSRLVFSINDLAKENTDLQVQNAELQAKLAKLTTVQGENDALRQDLNFKNAHSDLKLTPANVLTFSPTGLYQSFVIDKGSADGLKVNQGVVAGGFLIGKIHSVANNTAEVWLITNRNLTTPVILTGSQTVGLLTGGIRGLIVDNIPLETKIAIGEPVVTSSLEGIYPAGIAVGQVEEILSKKEDIFLSLRVSTPVKFGNLTVVFVVS